MPEPNAVTVAAMQDARDGTDMVRVAGVDELFADLHGDSSAQE
jgi:hypothetical protein